MTTHYKNKRDQYKAEAAEERRLKDIAQRELYILKEQKKKKDEEDKKRYSVTVYCTNCMHVNDVLIPPGVTIKEGDCVTCRVRNTQLLVIKYPKS